MSIYKGSQKIKDIYFGTKNTNCLTHIPQDIKLDLADGKLTLKAGSKVYVPNGKNADGSNKFDEVVISSDVSVTIASNNKFFIFYNYSDNNLWFSDNPGTRSGTTNPDNLWGFFYNTTDNKVYYLRNGTTPDNLTFSFPIALVISNGTQITSIDQIFNGFGYIGNTYYMLPNVKFLRPSGINPDGTYKNKESEYVVNSVVTRTTTYKISNGVLFSDGGKIEIGDTSQVYEVENTLPTPTSFYERVYVRAENKWYYHRAEETSWIPVDYICVLGKGKIDGKITSLTPNEVQPETTVRKIGRVFKGSTLLYGYGINQTVFESSSAGTYTVDLKYGGNYSIVIVGGGGGGAGTQSTNAAAAAGGGSGACIQCNVKISKPTTLTIVVGNTGAGATVRDGEANGGNGGASSIKFDNDLTYTANGGTQGKSWWKSGATAGAGASEPTGITSNSYITVSNVTTLAGKTGGSTTSNGGGTVSGGASVYNGYGKGGDGYASALNSTGYAGTTGYVKVVAI